MRHLILLLAAGALWAQPVKLYVGAWPGRILEIDEPTLKVTREIPLKTGVARTVHLTHDRKRLIVTTMKDSGVEIVDLASGQVVDSWMMNEGAKRVRFSGQALDPTDRYLYCITSTATKLIDRFEIGTPQFAVIDLVEKKVVRTAEYPKDERPGGFRGGYRVSPDGKFLYQFGESILVFNTSDFKLVEKIELSKPIYPGMETFSLSGGDDPHDAPGAITSVFNSSDPVVHRTNYGIAQFDLNTRKFVFTPVGPATAGMIGMRLTPDRKTGYAVAIHGEHGDRRCEFWTFDMATKKVVSRAEFPGRTRFNFSLSSDGKDLYIYGAGNTLEVFDSKTLKMRHTLDVNADMTTPLVVVMPRKAGA